MKHEFKKVHFCLYHHDTKEKLEEFEYALDKTPPVPQKGDFIGVGGTENTLFAVSQVTHYFESPVHEVALLVMDHLLWQQEPEESAPLDEDHTPDADPGENHNHDGSL